MNDDNPHNENMTLTKYYIKVLHRTKVKFLIYWALGESDYYIFIAVARDKCIQESATEMRFLQFLDSKRKQ